MGHSSSSTYSLDKVRSQTRLNPQEIQDWYKKFYKDFPNGVVQREDFHRIYKQMFPDGDPTEYAEHAFRAYDVDGNGEIDFTEFMITLSVMSKGSTEEKLHYAFRLYDIDGNGFVTRDEAVRVVSAIFKMKAKENISEKANQTVEHMFSHLDKNKDDRLSEKEFVRGAKSSREIMDLLQGR